MFSVNVQPKGLRQLLKKYENAPEKITAELRKRLQLVGLKVKTLAKRYAKLSPINVKTRGGLIRSISYETKETSVRIYVPDNSQAGDYAFIQHNKLKGRGPGTIRRGKQAGWKYIARAIDDSEEWIKKVLGDSVEIIEHPVIG